MPLSRRHRRLVWIVLALLLVGGRWLAQRLEERSRGQVGRSEAAVAAAFEEKRSGVMVEVAGVVDRVLSDDLEGSRHQRLILRLASGQTLLVSHNIDLAPRVPVQRGDRLEVRGQYEWNERGGVVHWTHDDPGGRRAGGWIRHRGSTYR